MSEDSPELFSKIKADLPNFPDEVIRGWLLRYAEQEGWPPDRSRNAERWSKLLRGDLEKWQAASWSSEEMDISLLTSELSYLGKMCLAKMKMCYWHGEENEYTELKTRDGGKRWSEAFKYILENGKFPEAIVIEETSEGYEVADGNHRLLAWTTVQGFLLQQQTKSQEQQLERLKIVGVHSVSPLSMIQNVWVARFPWS